MKPIWIFLFVFSTNVHACDKVFRMPTDLTYPQRQQYPWPYIAQIFEKAGCPFEWVELQGNPSRLLKLLENGEADVFAEASIRPERLGYAMFSEPYRVEHVRLFVLTEDLPKYQIDKVSELSNKRWRVIDDRSMYLGPEWAKVREILTQENLIMPADSPDGAMRLLRTGKAHIIAATDAWGMSTYTSKNGFSPLALDIHSANVHLMFSRKTVAPKYVALIDEAIRALNAEANSEQK